MANEIKPAAGEQFTKEQLAKGREVTRYYGSLSGEMPPPPPVVGMNSGVPFSEADEQKQAGELSEFKTETLRRLHEDHPELIDHWMPLVEDEDPYGRVFGLTALHALLDVRDIQKGVKNNKTNVETGKD